MRILVVGGTGLIGGHAALFLKSRGHEVSLASRTPPPPQSPLAELPFVQGNYVEGGFSEEQLRPFDALLFAAGADIRHVPQNDEGELLWAKANSEGIPRFFELAKSAGVKRAVYIGSFYPQVLPHLVKANAYVRSRHEADLAVRALSTGDFCVCSLNAPFVVGEVPGLHSGMFEYYTRYFDGKLGLPIFAPPGGTNFISTDSLSEAILGALERGECGKAYLLGDQNLTFQEYFQAFARGVGRDEVVPVENRESPLLPDDTLYSGRGNLVQYEPDPADVTELGYERRDVRPIIEAISKRYLSDTNGQ